jgi:nicotinamidase-related amidase
MTTALVLLDLQRSLVANDALAFENPALRDGCVRAATALLDAARKAGAPVVHVGVVRPARKGFADTPRTQAAIASGKVPRDILPMAAGSEGVQFVLQVESGEDIVHKAGVSAFEGTRLDQLLRSAGVTDVVIGGAFTHMVVESTARQGFDLGYRMVVAKDACCAPKNVLHDNSLATGIPNFAVVEEASQAAARFAKQGGR